MKLKHLYLILFLTLQMGLSAQRKFTHSDTLMALGTNLYKQNEINFAKIILDSCIILNAENDQCIYYRGRIAFDEKQYELSKLAFKSVLALAPEDYTAWNLLGMSFMELHQFDSAEFCYQNAVALNSRESQIYANWAKNEFMRNDLEHAEGLYNTALLLNDSNSSYYASRSVVKEKLGKTEEAKADLEKAKEINPNDEVVKKNEPKSNYEKGTMAMILILIVFVLTGIFLLIRHRKNQAKSKTED